VENLKDMLSESAEIYADNCAFLLKSEKGNYETLSYKEYKQEVDALGTELLYLGLKDSNISIMSENRYEWCVAYLAVACGVGRVVPFDKELTANEVSQLVNFCGARALFFSPKLFDKAIDIFKNSKSIEYGFVFDGDDKKNNTLDEMQEKLAKLQIKVELFSFSKLIEQGKQKILENHDKSYINCQVKPDDTAAILFTSGTTGNPKGVMLSHFNICSNITGVCKTVMMYPSDRTLCILPLHHTYQCTIGFLGFIYNGCSIAFCEGLKYISKNLKETSPTVLVAVPLLLENIYNKIIDQASKKTAGRVALSLFMKTSSLLMLLGIDVRKKIFKKIHDNFGGQLRLIISGAAAIDPKISKAFRVFGFDVLQGYGLTECSPLVAGNRDKLFKDDSVGFAIPGMEVDIFEPNDEGIGEIIVKGCSVMQGYYKNAEATNACIKNGWFHTGDLGRVDKKGFLYITGRCKNMILGKNGKNIYPEELEEYINRSPYVLESMVWGEEDEKTGEPRVKVQIFPNMEAIGERLKAVNVTKEELMKIFNELIKNVNKNLPSYKHIKEVVLRDKEFIKTSTKKIKRYLEHKNDKMATK